MVKALRIKKIRFQNPYPRFQKNFEKDATDLPEREAAFTRRRARSIMKKAPKRPRTKYGRMRIYQSGKKKNQTYWRKGLYSRPGHPPFYHTDGFNLRTIWFGRIGNPTIPHKRTLGGDMRAFKVGPKYRRSRHSTPVPQLHEYGGRIRLRKQRGTYTDKGLTFTRSLVNGTGTLKYPARPYMRPAAKEARQSARAKGGGSVKRLTKMGRVHRVKGITAKRIY